MGSTLSCLGPSESNVLLIKPNGKVMKIKAGTRVKEIRASYPRHVVMLRSSGLSDRSVSALPDSFELGGDKTYFLVAEGEKEYYTLETLISLARIRESPRPKAKAREDKTNIDNDHSKLTSSSSKEHKGGNQGAQQLNVGQDFLLKDASLEHRKSLWKPALHTIPEIHSQETP